MIEKVFIKQAFDKIKLENFFEEKLSRAGYNHLEIVKSPIATRVIIYVAKPGLAIGYSGKNINFLSNSLETQFNIKNPHIEIRAIANPEFDVKYKVNYIIRSLERGINWKTLAYRTVRDLTSLKLMGFEIIFKGKLMAKNGRKQKHRVQYAYMKKAGNQVNLVKEGKGTAYTKSGAIGITLKIIPPNTIFSDKVDRKQILEQVKNIYSELDDEEKKEVVKLDKQEKINNTKELKLENTEKQQEVAK